MKRSLCLILALTLLVLCGCGKTASTASAPSGPTETATMPEVFSQDEYMLYQNVFYGDYGPDAAGKPVEKQGVLAILHDAFNQRERYYVWGYYDKTKCCDWQWEFVPEDPASLPAPGSLITVTGTFAAAEDALDGYWIEGAKTSAEKIFTGAGAELNMAVMSCTLERVQMYNILYKSEDFEGKSFTAYGRLAADSMLQDPYYDGSWQIGYRWDGKIPGLELLCAMSGQVQGGTLSVQSLESMES